MVALAVVVVVDSSMAVVVEAAAVDSLVAEARS